MSSSSGKSAKSSSSRHEIPQSQSKAKPDTFHTEMKAGIKESDGKVKRGAESHGDVVRESQAKRKRETSKVRSTKVAKTLEQGDISAARDDQDQSSSESGDEDPPLKQDQLEGSSSCSEEEGKGKSKAASEDEEESEELESEEESESEWSDPELSGKPKREDYTSFSIYRLDLSMWRQEYFNIHWDPDPCNEEDMLALRELEHTMGTRSLSVSEEDDDDDVDGDGHDECDDEGEKEKEEDEEDGTGSKEAGHEGDASKKTTTGGYIDFDTPLTKVRRRVCAPILRDSDEDSWSSY